MSSARISLPASRMKMNQNKWLFFNKTAPAFFVTKTLGNIFRRFVYVVCFLNASPARRSIIQLSGNDPRHIFSQNKFSLRWTINGANFHKTTFRHFKKLYDLGNFAIF